MKLLSFFFLILFMFKAESSEEIFYDFSIESISGETINLSDYKSKVVLLVNTASKCGFTPQYSGLQTIYDRYKEDGLVVLGVPTNDFNQELSKDSEVKEFCEIRFGVEFPMSSIQPIRGENAHPIYKWIKSNVSAIGQPRWNFHKYLIGKDGKIINWFSSLTSPTSEGLVNQIETALYD